MVNVFKTMFYLHKAISIKDIEEIHRKDRNYGKYVKPLSSLFHSSATSVIDPVKHRSILSIWKGKKKVRSHQKGVIFITKPNLQASPFFM